MDSFDDFIYEIYGAFLRAISILVLLLFAWLLLSAAWVNLFVL